MLEIVKIAAATIAAAAVVTALLGAGFSQLVKREKNLAEKHALPHSHDDVSTGHPNPV